MHVKCFILAYNMSTFCDIRILTPTSGLNRIWVIGQEIEAIFRNLAINYICSENFRFLGLIWNNKSQPAATLCMPYNILLTRKWWYFYFEGKLKVLSVSSKIYIFWDETRKVVICVSEFFYSLVNSSIALLNKSAQFT